MHKNALAPYGTLYILPLVFHTNQTHKTPPNCTAILKPRGSYCKKNVNNPQKVMTKKKIYGRI